MKINGYFAALNKKSQEIFCTTVENEIDLAMVHDWSSKFYEASKHLNNNDESRLIRVLCSQLESSCLALSFGLYRQALASLRLSFELGLGSVHFSVHKLEHKEWLAGSGDIKWSKIIDADNGVLSDRFFLAFFPKVCEHAREYNSRAKTIYRNLSEYVHGNSETWKECGLILERNPALEKKYFSCFSEVSEILLFLIFCRYANEFKDGQVEDLSYIFENLNHIAPIREFFGGPKDIK